jgi:hypothetical protein
MSDSNSKIILAVGLTALVVAVVLIGGFLGFLYLRQPVAPARVDGARSDAKTPRPMSANPVAAADITKVSYLESSMANRAAMSPAAYLSNINMSNYSSSSSTVTFSSDGTATKQTASESTVNGVKQTPKNEGFTGTVDSSAFAALAQVFADNDFANEPDSRDITSLQIRKILTITYNGGEKTIVTGHMGRNSIETSAMLAAIKELEAKVSWLPAK